MADAALKPMTREEFLAWDAKQPDLYEFIAGEVYAMTGGSWNHYVIAANVLVALATALRGTPCRALGAGIKVGAAQDYLYPDVLVTCEQRNPTDQIIEEPRVIIEILSPSTEVRDRRHKWTSYQALPSLQYYLLVSQDQVRVEMFARTTEGWAYSMVTDIQRQIDLQQLEVTLPLAEIYRGCFPAEDKAGSPA